MLSQLAVDEGVEGIVVDPQAPVYLGYMFPMVESMDKSTQGLELN